LGKAQDDEIKDFLNDVISYLQGEVGDNQGNEEGDGQSDQATDGASNMAGAGGTGGGQSQGGMQTPVTGMQNS